jgi:hypothetical protein
MNSTEKSFTYKVLNLVQALQLWYRMCLHLRLFEKFKNLTPKICELKTNI